MDVVLFEELSEEAKGIAVSEVHKKEWDREWDIQTDLITETLEEELNELKITHNGVYWSSHYGCSVDLSSIELNEETFEKHLTLELYELYKELKVISNGYLQHFTYHKDFTKKFILSFDFVKLNYSKAIEFLMKHETDEDTCGKLAFLSLFSNDLNEKQKEIIEQATLSLGDKLSLKIEDFIIEKLFSLEDHLRKIIQNEMHYFYSPEYTKHLLEENEYDCKYEFLCSGHIATIDGNTTEKYEEVCVA